MSDHIMQIRDPIIPHTICNSVKARRTGDNSGLILLEMRRAVILPVAILQIETVGTD